MFKKPTLTTTLIVIVGFLTLCPVVMLLLGLRTGLIVGSFIPLVMLFGLLMMSVLGIDLERMSLATMMLTLTISASAVVAADRLMPIAIEAANKLFRVLLYIFPPLDSCRQLVGMYLLLLGDPSLWS